MNYNAVLAKKDGSYIPIRHDFETYDAFVRNYMQDYDDALSSGKYQVVVGDLVVDVEDVSHIQPIYEEEVVEEQGGAKRLQLFGDGFMVEGDPYELAVFAKNLGADEIRMSDACCEDETDCCGVCDSDCSESCRVDEKGIQVRDNTGQIVMSMSNGNLSLIGCDSCNGTDKTYFALIDLRDGSTKKIGHSFQSFDAFRNEVHHMIAIAQKSEHNLISIGNIMIDFRDIKCISPM